MRVLLTGATGYIGRRLADRFLGETEVELRLFVRNAARVAQISGPRVEVAEGDTFQPNALAAAMANVDVAYYLIHSMGGGGDYAARDRLSAENFREAAITAGVRRIIYLGGLGVRETASEHLRSRLETGEILSAKPKAIQTLWFRAGVIIGSGSASFEIIRNLVQKAPVLITPRWVRTRTEPIAVADVLSYLAAARDVNAEGNVVVDVGAGVTTFAGLLREAARIMGLRRPLLPLPFFTPRMGAYGLVLLTPVPFAIASSLVEGLRSETVKQNENAAGLFPDIKPRSYDRAFREALAEIEARQVLSRWCDADAEAVCERGPQQIEAAVYALRRSVPTGELPPALVFQAACTVGGETGWFRFGFLWKLRGWIDKLCGGPGSARGRRDPVELRAGDAVDFWKAVEVRPPKRILLAAQLRLPGRGWFDFVVEGGQLTVTAYFYPRGLMGRLYWYGSWLFHVLILAEVARGVVARAQRLAGRAAE
ncbi:MAG: SDR family oxidoreductase [Candidatus Coatesbacteria bacterium]|nr:MAG: SDR family oxidoreductase [Candidatus Coatesbacteria bacterium]